MRTRTQNPTWRGSDPSPQQPLVLHRYSCHKANTKTWARDCDTPGELAHGSKKSWFDSKNSIQCLIDTIQFIADYHPRKREKIREARKRKNECLLSPQERVVKSAWDHVWLAIICPAKPKSALEHRRLSYTRHHTHDASSRHSARRIYNRLVRI